MLHRSQGTIWSLENGIIKNISLENAEKIITEVRKLTSIPNEEILVNRIHNISNRGRFYGDYAKRMSRRASKDNSIRSAVMQMPTKQEGNLLKELKKQEIPFKFHGIIKASRTFVVDFVFPSETNPKVILEMKDLPSNFRKRLLAIELAYRSMKIKQKYPNVKTIAVIDGGLQNDAFEILKDEYDKVLLSPSLYEISKVVKLCTGSVV